MAILKGVGHRSQKLIVISINLCGTVCDKNCSLLNRGPSHQKMESCRETLKPKRVFKGSALCFDVFKIR